MSNPQPPSSAAVAEVIPSSKTQQLQQTQLTQIKYPGTCGTWESGTGIA